MKLRPTLQCALLVGAGLATVTACAPDSAGLADADASATGSSGGRSPGSNGSSGMGSGASSGRGGAGSSGSGSPSPPVSGSSSGSRDSESDETGLDGASGSSEASSASDAGVDGSPDDGSLNGDVFDGGNDAPSDTDATGDSAVDGSSLSFAADVYPIITARCIACHAPGGSGVMSGHLDLTTNFAAGAYSRLMMKAMGTVPGGAGLSCAASALFRVIPGSSATSLLYDKVNSKLTGGPALCGNPMPNPTIAPSLLAAQITTIGTWIDQGAKP